MISFMIGEKSMLAHHLSFQTLQTITFSHTVTHLLLLYLKFFQQFLEHLCITKQNEKLNHMESNLWKILHDSATLSELAILSFYGEVVSYSYVKAICSTSKSGKKQNMLDLGSLHQKVSTHIWAIIANPSKLFCENPSFNIASFEGNE